MDKQKHVGEKTPVGGDARLSPVRAGRYFYMICLEPGPEVALRHELREE